jgi:hypothetical protein
VEVEVDRGIAGCDVIKMARGSGRDGYAVEVEVEIEVEEEIEVETSVLPDAT